MKKLRVTYSAQTGGLFNGAMLYRMEFTGEEITEQEMVQVVMALHEHSGGLKREKSGILLTGTFPSDNCMNTLLTPLNHQKYRLIIESNGFYKSWFTFAFGLRVVLRDTKWTPFLCTELWYTSDEKVEPLFLKEPNPPTLFLKTKKKATYDYFVRESGNTWNMLFTPPVAYVDKVLEV